MYTHEYNSQSTGCDIKSYLDVGQSSQLHDSGQSFFPLFFFGGGGGGVGGRYAVFILSTTTSSISYPMVIQLEAVPIWISHAYIYITDMEILDDTF